MWWTKFVIVWFNRATTFAVLPRSEVPEKRYHLRRYKIQSDKQNQKNHTAQTIWFPVCAAYSACTVEDDVSFLCCTSVHLHKAELASEQNQTVRWEGLPIFEYGTVRRIQTISWSFQIVCVTSFFVSARMHVYPSSYLNLGNGKRTCKAKCQCYDTVHRHILWTE